MHFVPIASRTSASFSMENNHHGSSFFRFQRARGKQPQIFPTRIRRREELKEPETKDFISLINANDSKKSYEVCPKSEKGRAFDLNRKPPEKDCDVASSSNHQESNKVEPPPSKDDLDLTLRLCSVHALP